jgi:transposase-like protein
MSIERRRRMQTDADSGVERLRRSFTAFRKRHAGRTRIPDALRQEVLATLEEGATESEVRRACGVTAEQLLRWRKRERAEAPLVFPIVEEPVAAGMAEGEPDLELRLGRWFIRIGQVEG